MGMTFHCSPARNVVTSQNSNATALSKIRIAIQQPGNAIVDIGMGLKKLLNQDIIEDSLFAKVNVAELFGRTSTKDISGTVDISIEFRVTMPAEEGRLGVSVVLFQHFDEITAVQIPVVGGEQVSQSEVHRNSRRFWQIFRFFYIFNQADSKPVFFSDVPALSSKYGYVFIGKYTGLRSSRVENSIQ